MRAPYGPTVWVGPVVYLIALLGTLLLANDSGRPCAVLLLVASMVSAVVLWGRQNWIPAFPTDATAPTRVNRSRSLLGVGVAMLLVLAADVRYAAAPTETFGLAGFLWIAGIALLLCSAFGVPRLRGSEGEPPKGGTPNQVPLVVPRSATDLQCIRWTSWEIALLAMLFGLALLSRVWNLTNFPNNIYPDEIMTGTVATQSYLAPTSRSPSLFRTLWSGIDLPALWFWIVALFLKLGGTSLAMLRLPAALFAAATIIPLYGLLRATWGRYAAIAGSAIMAFSISNVHYSRLALNNIVTQFFWVTCFFFLLRALRSRRPSDWVLAGLSAGLSENFYYGTRLLPFILALFMVFLLALHWKQARQYGAGFLLLAGSYFVGFGPLLVHFIRNPNLYLGRGASLLIWSPHIPISFADFRETWNTMWPVLGENLLGISTHSSQDIIFFAPLLLPAESALLVLGFALLVWHWRHPAAFLILASGVGVLLVGGTLVAYPNSAPPLINHWTPAFPAFYVTLAVPIGAWATVAKSELKPRMRWILPATVCIALLVLGWCNLNFYFNGYYADPESLKTKAYRSAQQNYEIQTAQSRYFASLGSNYEVFTVGQSQWPYDPVTTQYLVREQKWTLLTAPATELASIARDNQGMSFLFFPGNEQYEQTTHELFPGGKHGEVTSRRGKHLFYTYVLTPSQSEESKK
jgi:4-amino-4-deoxy-L-arabinose transferase-like glycosyltransferase